MEKALTYPARAQEVLIEFCKSRGEENLKHAERLVAVLIIFRTLAIFLGGAAAALNVIPQPDSPYPYWVSSVLFIAAGTLFLFIEQMKIAERSGPHFGQADQLALIKLGLECCDPNTVTYEELESFQKWIDEAINESGDKIAVLMDAMAVMNKKLDSVKPEGK